MIATRQDIRRAAGRVIFCGFDGTTLSAELKEIMREARPSGLVLFARNVEDPRQVAELNRELKMHRADDPLLLSVDQEGGRVARVRAPATEWPSMRTLGQTGDEQLAERFGRALARELRAMSFDVDFAPVLDVDTNPDNPVIGDRSFGRAAEWVGRMGAAVTRGLQAEGVAACGKHFPGHGDTDVDSHKALPRVSHDLARLREVEWPPFADAIAAGLSSVMTAHVVVEALDDERPATLSSRALAPLRSELGFEGVIISDDLEMKAVADNYSLERMAVMGLNAGVDLFLACHAPEVILGLYRAVVQAVEREEVSTERLLDAERRVLAWRDRFYAGPSAPADVMTVVGAPEHAELLTDIEVRLQAGS